MPLNKEIKPKQNYYNFFIFITIPSTYWWQEFPEFWVNHKFTTVFGVDQNQEVWKDNTSVIEIIQLK